jgi:thiol-disulfide isomerase/thioredoxin
MGSSSGYPLPEHAGPSEAPFEITKHDWSSSMKHLLGKSSFVTAAIILAFGALSISSADATSTSAATKSNPAAYSFNAKTVKGGNFSGHELAGKPAVLWFWAPWCAICRGEAPDLAALASSFKGKIKVVGVAGLGPVKDMKQFVAQTHTGNFTHLADVSGVIWQRFQVVSQPSFVFITSKGTMYREVGSLSKTDLFTLTKQLIAKSR